MQNKYFNNDYILTEKDKKTLLDLYYQNIKLEEMKRITNFPIRKIRNFFRDNNLNLIKRYTLNENYFENVNTPKKAYWLGYLWTDGFVGSGKYNNIVLSSIDENVIDEFNKDISLSGINFKKVHTDRNTSYGDKTLFESRFSSFKMAENLRNFNIVANRKENTFLPIENFPLDILKCVLFGMIDGDGYLSSRNGKLISVSLYATTNNLDSYVNFIKMLNLSYSIKYNKEKECNYIRFLLKDDYTRETIKEYLDTSLIKRKSAPLLS